MSYKPSCLRRTYLLEHYRFVADVMLARFRHAAKKYNELVDFVHGGNPEAKRAGPELD